MKTLSVGIIGAGRIGRLHAENILQSNNLHLKAVCDINTEHLKGSFIEKNVPIITTNVSKLLSDDDIEAVIICSSTDTHSHYIKEAAISNKHIFCEKPISKNVTETEEVLRVIKENGVKLQVGFNRRFDKHFRKVQQTVQSKQIGTPQLIKISSRDPEPPTLEYVAGAGGMFMDMTIHDFDMARYLADSEVVDISVNATNVINPQFSIYDDVDTAIITMTFENGALGVIDNSRQAVYGYDQRVEVFGDKGVVSADNENETNVKIATQETVSMDHPKYFFLERYHEAYREELNEFANAIIRNKPLLCTGNDGFQAEKLAFAAKKSKEENRTICLSELNNLFPTTDR
ncbi:myo-inositol 2-dehydrogenase/D-chiro-inositol 1-dehydrogenase [Geomicrobium halophilum]|uniref:Myo-inositol 2-dehydrogenase/D-chiro-inositol 1-dehydrogenase n=1 Tax=Geomicrobium halophilum TaxID=549000 RepID=A0A841PR65_9BACL|nr:inositol 2-dehydrogenase [Geomicrobium halophilum]MBB6448781.1 myo-inositol 2-dehydrogenase/D-chiro-inositol 1-dehydrogenase [Geomicrobium halophilum]